MLALKITALGQNDSKALILLDASGTYTPDNLTGWGSPNYTLSAVDGTSGHNLTITISIRTTEGTTQYKPINLFNTFAGGTPWTTPSQLVFTITPDLLFDSNNTALGVNGDTLPDGIYSVVYSYDIDSTTNTSIALFVSGVVRNAIYKQLLNNLLDLIEYNDRITRSKYYDVLYNYTLLRATQNCGSIARNDQLIDGLKTLQKATLTTIYATS